MNKNVKSIFFVATILIVLVGVSGVSAVDESDDATLIQDSTDTLTTGNTGIDNNVATENYKKDNKNIKTATKTVDVNNFTQLQDAINMLANDSEIDEGIINLNDGDYQSSGAFINKQSANPNIIINANNQVFYGGHSAYYIRFNNRCNITINNAVFNMQLQNYYNLNLNNVTVNGSLTNNANSNIVLSDCQVLQSVSNNGNITLTGNCLINNTFQNNGNLTIGDDVVLEEKCLFTGNGNTIINDTNKILPYLKVYNGNYVIENANLTTSKQNTGNLTIINSNITGYFSNTGNLNIINSSMNYTINNRGNITIDDDSIFEETFMIDGSGNVTYNNSSKIVNHLSSYNGNYIIENTIINKSKSNYGNLTIRNSTINATITNYANLTIEDDVIFTDKAIIGIRSNGTLITDNMSIVLPYMDQYNNTYVVENANITQLKTNYGNLTIRNCTLNCNFYNYGNLTIEDDVIFGEKFSLTNQQNGTLIINNTTKIAPYLSSYSGLFTLENVNITTSKSNNGNLTIINCTVTGSITNRGNIIVKNSIINSSIITYSGSLIFDDDVEFGNKCSFGGSPTIIINDTSRIAPYVSSYNGNYTLNNATITSQKTNTKNLTINNSTISAKLTNSGNLIVENNSTINGYIPNSGTMTVRDSTLNSEISNSGTLIIEDNVIFGSSFTITGKGNIITDDINNLFEYIYDFTGQTTIELGEYSKQLTNSGNLTIENSTIKSNMITNNANAYLLLDNTTITNNTASFVNRGTVELKNTTVNTKINNIGTLIISDDTILDENFILIGSGEIIINDTNKVAEFIKTYNGNITLNNKTINETKTNYQNLTLNNCIINSTIDNQGILFIDEDTQFTENAKITGYGKIVTDDLTRVLPYLETINGNYTFNNIILNKSYLFVGNITLNNCSIESDENVNLGVLYLNDCTSTKENSIINNYETIILNDNTTINEKINNQKDVFINNPSENWTYNPTYHIVNNDTVIYFFNSGGMTALVNPADTLDFQGVITTKTGKLTSISITKPVNIITSTNDGKIEDFGQITYTQGASGSNVTGLYTYNTQFYVRNASDIVFDNISNVVDNKQVGWGVGQSSIRENSSNITVKNSYFYTNNNGGSSTLVLAWADNCTILNNTIVGGEYVGNLLYLTTYNVDIPNGVIPNSNNKLINNTVTTQYNSAICIGVVFCGVNNTIDGNIINTTGGAISYQWGSGVDGVIQEVSLFETKNNNIINNKIYGGTISGGDIYINNYIEKSSLSANNAQLYNNTIYRLSISYNTTVKDNNITTIQIADNAKNIIIENNNIQKTITIPVTASNITIDNNTINDQIITDAPDTNITNNNITTDKNYTITGTATNNIIKNNYLVANNTIGDASVNLDKQTNTIENNRPKENELTIETTEFTVGQTSTIKASIYNDGQIVNTINKGKITFKVNGKTLKDANGKVIYAKVINGTATIENYTIPDTWKEGTTIQAIYSGSSQCKKLSTEKTNITIRKAVPTLTTEDINTTVGGTITLKATITDNDKVINSGKIVFKINGKTIKDANGKVIYAKVVNNTVTVEYTLPEDMKTKDYTITATFISPDYDKLTDEKTLKITA